MTEADQLEHFSELLQKNYRSLYGYIYSLVRDFSDTDELLQDTCLILWQKFDEFDPHTNFMTWACQVAKYTVLNFLRKEHRRKSRFSDPLQSHLLAIASEAVEMPEDDRREALEHCVDKLPPEQRELLWDFYGGTKSVDQIASERSRASAGIYGSLHHIRRKLLACVERYLAREMRS